MKWTAGSLADALAKLPRDAEVYIDFRSYDRERIEESLQGSTLDGRTGQLPIVDVQARLQPGHAFAYITAGRS